VKVWPATLKEPVREVEAVLGATAYAIPPGPLPVAPLFTVIHDAVLVAVQPQPVWVVTVTVPLPPVEGAEPADGVSENVQDVANENVLDGELSATPPGPIAPTRASYTTPVGSGGEIRETKSTRILPSDWMAGLPRFIDWNGMDSPARYSSI